MRSADSNDVTRPSGPWWREPTMWLVVSGPLSVVLACVVTAWFVWHGSDRVIPVAADQAVDEGAPGPGQPALKARNHAASPR